MAQRLKKSALMFGQVAQEPPKPTLSEFYGGVGKGQIGAVQEVSKGVQEKTAQVPGQFGIEYKDGVATFTEGSPFKPTVNLTTSTQPMPTDYGTTSAEAGKVSETAEKALSTIDTEEKGAEAELGKSAGTALTKAGEASTAAQGELTEKKLGERREASELEKQAQDYRNQLATDPGTSNIGAVANLMRFYDMSKYGTLESGLRQGEIALARQEAGITDTAMAQAEGERAGSIEGYKTTSEQAYKDAKALIDKEKEDKLKELRDYYSDLRGSAQLTKDEADRLKGEREVIEQEALVKDLGIAGDAIKNNDTISGLKQIFSDISGRAGDNWLNTQGHAKLKPIESAINSLVEEAIRVQNDPNLSLQERINQLNTINQKINGYRPQIAGELTAFLDDKGTSPDDALSAAEQIVARGLINDLSPEQKKIIMDRIYSDQGPQIDEKRQRIYSAFGGGSLEYRIKELIAARDEELGQRYVR